MTLAAGVLVFVLLGAIAVFLVVKAFPRFKPTRRASGPRKIWDPDGTGTSASPRLCSARCSTSLLALVMAVPVALGVSLYITQYAPRG